MRMWECMSIQIDQVLYNVASALMMVVVLDHPAYNCTEYVLLADKI